MFLGAAWRKRSGFPGLRAGGSPCARVFFCEGDKGGGKASPGEKSFGKPSVVDREAKRNVPPRDPIPSGNLGCGQSPP